MARRRSRAGSKRAVSAAISEAAKLKRKFLREVSQLLSDALGYDVRVSLVRAPADLSPDQRRASRRSAKANRRLIAESFAPFDELPDDPLS